MPTMCIGEIPGGPQAKGDGGRWVSGSPSSLGSSFGGGGGGGTLKSAQGGRTVQRAPRSRSLLCMEKRGEGVLFCSEKEGWPEMTGQVWDWTTFFTTVRRFSFVIYIRIQKCP